MPRRATVHTTCGSARTCVFNTNTDQTSTGGCGVIRGRVFMSYGGCQSDTNVLLEPFEWERMMDSLSATLNATTSRQPESLPRRRPLRTCTIGPWPA